MLKNLTAFAHLLKPRITGWHFRAIFLAGPCLLNSLKRYYSRRLDGLIFSGLYRFFN